MEVDIFGAMASAAQMLARPDVLFFVVLGVCFGTVLAVIPGIGGLLGVALLLPFTFAMDPVTALAFLLGALAISSTADTIPAVLFGVPGTPTSMVTVLDGYPMAQRGEAGRALGAAFTASICGGVIGALLLLGVLPVVMPLLMGTTSAELLAFCILGMTMVAALSGGSMMKGLAAASLGVLIALIGQDSQTATLRWTFDMIYLWDGVSIVVMVLAIYALPELADLAIHGRSIAKDAPDTGQMRGARRGIADTFGHFWLVVRSSGISAALGTLPAIGPAVIPWIVYSYTTMRTRGESRFGRGDVRGVIAAEASNNATVGGSLLPTVALGIPGSAPMALILGAFLLHGIAPGPDMLSKNLDFTYMMVWTIVLANVIGGALAFLLSVQLARVVFVRASVLVPLVLAVVFAGAVQASRVWEDLFFLLLLGTLGWVMKRARWSRAPFVLAFILAPLVEQYYFIADRIHGWQWVLRPAVAVILGLTVLTVAAIAARRVIAMRRSRGPARRIVNPVWSVEVGMALAAAAASAAALVSAGAWPAAARTLPQIAAATGVIMAIGALFAVWTKPPLAAGARPEPGSENEELHYDITTDFGDLSERAIYLRGLRYLLLCCAYFALAWLVGVLAAVPLFITLYMMWMGESWRLSLAVAVPAAVVAYLVFHVLLRLAWPTPLWDVGARLGLFG